MPTNNCYHTTWDMRDEKLSDAIESEKKIRNKKGDIIFSSHF